MLPQNMRNIKSYSELGLKERERNYNFHIKKIEEITDKDSKIKQIKDQHARIVQIIQHSKNISRSFRKHEDARSRINQNTKMLLALIDIKRKPRMLTEWKKMDEEIEIRKSRSRTPKKTTRHEDQEVKQSNFHLADSLLHHSASIKKYRKKVKGEIAEYLKRRNHLQKARPVQNFPLPHTNKHKRVSLHREKRIKTIQPSNTPSQRAYLSEIPQDSYDSARKE